MATVRVSRTVAASPREVWSTASDLAGHSEWMVDVVAIRFTSDRSGGVGTTYDCVTRLGPMRMTIPMEIVEWEPCRAMAARYDGTLNGGGRLTLRRRGRRRTKVTWRARVRFPWWLGGPVGALGAAQPLRLVWRRNLANLAARLEDPAPAVRRSGSKRGTAHRRRTRRRSPR